MSALHSLQDSVHKPFPTDWVVADAAALAALSVTANDLYKFALQIDTLEVYMLTAITPTWTLVGGGTPAGPTFPFSIISVDAGGDADYTDVATAVAAAGAGDVVVIGPGTYTLSAALSIPVGVSIVGHGRSITTLQCTANLSGSDLITLNNNAALRNLSVTWSNVTSNGSDAVHITGTNGLLDNLIVTLTATSTQFYSGIRVTGSGKVLNCNSTVSTSAAGVTYGLWLNPTGNTEVIGGFYSASTAGSTRYDLNLNANGGTYVLNGPTAVNGLYNRAGTTRAALEAQSGWFLSGAGGPIRYIREKISFMIDVSMDETTDLVATTGVRTFRIPGVMLIHNIRASVSTAPTDATIIIDINENTVSIFSTRLTIDATEKTSVTAAAPYVLAASGDELANDAEMIVDIDQVGSTIAGKGLKLWFYGEMYL